MKTLHKLIQHSKSYTSVSVMLPSAWVRMQPKKFSHVDVEMFQDKIVVTPHFGRVPPKKKK